MKNKEVFVTLSAVELVFGFFPMFLIGWFIGLGMAVLIKKVMKRTAKGGGQESFKKESK